jgi:predicted patatin/cPLA2 family phospholipase
MFEQCLRMRTVARSAAARVGLLLVVTGLLAGVGGCGSAVKRNALPKEFTSQAVIPDMTGIRVWGDGIDPEFQAALIEAGRSHPVLADTQSPEGPGIGGLVLSGGGDGGAYGAGVLCGWTDRGDRPRFRMVTGVSTGALIAPAAFLGPKYDHVLRFYTEISPKDIQRQRSIIDWLRYDSAFDNGPLIKTIARIITDEMINDVAVEHNKGRRLYIQTVDLDAQRAVVWDMGAIANYRTPEARKLFRQVMIASTSIPGAFPPQFIKVKADGKVYDEMHVDGGTVSQMLMSTLPINLQTVQKDLRQDFRPRIHVIRNASISPSWSMVVPKLFPIAGRAVSTMIKAQGQTELSLMYFEAQRAGMDYYLAYIPDSYERKNPEEFDTDEMNRMFKVGYEQGKNNTAWQTAPPKYLPETDSTKK